MSQTGICSWCPEEMSCSRGEMEPVRQVPIYIKPGKLRELAYVSVQNECKPIPVLSSQRFIPQTLTPCVIRAWWVSTPGMRQTLIESPPGRAGGVMTNELPCELCDHLGQGGLTRATPISPGTTAIPRSTSIAL